MRLWLILIAGGIITYLIRLSFIYLFGRVAMPNWITRSLRFVPPAVLSAFVMTELLYHSGNLDISMGNTRLLAGLLAMVVAWRTRNILWTIIAGLGALWILGLL